MFIIGPKEWNNKLSFAFLQDMNSPQIIIRISDQDYTGILLLLNRLDFSVQIPSSFDDIDNIIIIIMTRIPSCKNLPTSLTDLEMKYQ